MEFRAGSVKLQNRERESIRIPPFGLCLMVIVNEKTTSSVLSVLLSMAKYKSKLFPKRFFNWWIKNWPGNLIVPTLNIEIKHSRLVISTKKFPRQIFFKESLEAVGSIFFSIGPIRDRALRAGNWKKIEKENIF